MTSTTTLHASRCVDRQSSKSISWYHTILGLVHLVTVLTVYVLVCTFGVLVYAVLPDQLVNTTEKGAEELMLDRSFVVIAIAARCVHYVRHDLRNWGAE